MGHFSDTRFVSFAPKAKRGSPKAESAQAFTLHNLKGMVIKMRYDFTPKGVCSRHISFDIDHGIVTNVSFSGGCNGNLKAIARLVEGKPAAEIAQILKGNTCGFKSTSCADQLSIALEQAISKENAG